jgi:thymidylate kinase
MVEPRNKNVEVEGNTSLEKIELPGGIYDLTGEIREYIEDDTPISDETLNILRTFDREYSFEKDIEKRGKEVILKRFDTALELFDIEEAKEAVAEGLSYAQKINPEIEIKPFPVVFLFVPYRGDAKALHGQGCAINVDALRKNRLFEGTTYEKIVSYVAHESTHVFLGQLDKKPPSENKSFEKGLYNFLWEEGLTTYIEPDSYAHHEVLKNDAPFWIGRINEWLKTDDVERKKEILRECLERESTRAWLKLMNRENLREVNMDGDLDRIFFRGLTEMNGPGYHIGAYLWEKQIEEGNSLKDLVMKGSGEMEKWIKDEDGDN